MAVVYELIIVPLFWTIIFPGYFVNQTEIPDVDDFQTLDQFEIGFIIVAGVMDHTIPLIVLMIDFSFNCIPFVFRHFQVTLILAIVYSVFNVIYSIKVEPIYPIADFNSPLAFLYPIGGLVWCILMYLFILHSSKVKLRKSNKNFALV